MLNLSSSLSSSWIRDGRTSHTHWSATTPELTTVLTDAQRLNYTTYDLKEFRLLVFRQVFFHPPTTLFSLSLIRMLWNRIPVNQIFQQTICLLLCTSTRSTGLLRTSISRRSYLWEAYRSISLSLSDLTSRRTRNIIAVALDLALSTLVNDLISIPITTISDSEEFSILSLGLLFRLTVCIQVNYIHFVSSVSSRHTWFLDISLSAHSTARWKHE